MDRKKQLCIMQDKAILMILDGWGIGKHDYTDAIFEANTPFIDSLYLNSPHCTLKTYGENVGLPEGQMGNSEVGHLNIGAGRIVWQMLVRINKAFENNTVQQLAGFKEILQNAQENTHRKIHLIGLVSDGGVHSSIDHLTSLCGIFKENGLDERVNIHAFLDGRDTDPHSGKAFIEQVLQHPNKGKAHLASIIGRYYAMDRDKRWERIKQAYDLMTKGTGMSYANALDGIAANYANGITDEFMEPLVFPNAAGEIGTIAPDDIVLCFNFRTDRGREITTALTQTAFVEQEMTPLPLHYYTLTEYDKTYKNVGILFDNSDLKMTLGEYLANKGLSQIRAAETEKYPHVTFFFSGGRETTFEAEKRIMIPSPKVATYDLQPEMSAIELKNAILNSIESDPVNFYCINFANADMVGHTGVFDAIKKACETVDQCAKEIATAALDKGYKIVIIADHGNADHAINEDGTPNTAHSTNPVPCFILGEENSAPHDGILADVAPTILKLMGLEQPEEMTGEPLY
jgi:2,3-bisphosphoglycerate-independent phosphoglycerate mutase